MKKKILLFALLPVVAIVLVMIAVIGVQTWKHRQEVQKELAANATLWDEGKRAEAVEQYKRLIEKDLASMPKSDRSIVVGRVIEYEADSDKTDSATTYIELARKQGIPLTLNGPKAQELAAQVQRERDAAELAKKDNAERQKKGVAEQAEKERQEKLAAIEQKKKEGLEREAAERAKKEAEEKAERDNAILITADKLFQEYRDNTVKANQQYKGKLLKVSGPMESTGTALFNKVVVSLKTSGLPVECTFGESHKDRIAKLDKGQVISVTGRCYAGGGYGVMLSECDFAQPITDATGKKLSAFKAIVEKLEKFDRFASAVERMKYANELQALSGTYEAIPFDPKMNRDEAKQIIQMFEKRVSRRFSGQEYNLIEASVLIMAQKLME